MAEKFKEASEKAKRKFDHLMMVTRPQTHRVLNNAINGMRVLHKDSNTSQTAGGIAQIGGGVVATVGMVASGPVGWVGLAIVIGGAATKIGG